MYGADALGPRNMSIALQFFMNQHTPLATDNQAASSPRIEQPLTPEQVSPEQEQARKEAVRTQNLAINPGDREEPNSTLQEKAQQVAVNVADITGEHVTVPTYFVVEDDEGQHKALHHVRDSEEISDVIRQARVNEDGEREWR